MSDEKIPDSTPDDSGSEHHIEATLILPGKKPSLASRLRNYFLTGVVVAAPIGLTIWITRWFIDLVDTWFTPLIPEQYRPDNYLPFNIPGIGLVIALVLLTLLGALTANIFGRSIIGFAENLVNRMPVVRSIYNALKQIFETVISQSGSSFQNVGLIEYPRPGVYSLVFISTSSKQEIAARIGEELVSVFLPTTPNPTSGFLLFVPRRDVIVLDMSIEEGAKMIISAGLVEPKYVPKPGEDGEPFSPT